MLDQCSDACGWISGVIAALSFGSFGVPIKLISNVKVDPLVMQSYKSTVCFLTCWLVIPLGEPFKFTPWGIVSGLFWVPGATAGIYGIRNAGLAISVGTWSSLIVITSFCWGIFVFGEKVKSVRGASGAALVLIVGLVGMSFYSAPVKAKKEKHEPEKVLVMDDSGIGKGDEEDNLSKPLLTSEIHRSSDSLSDQSTASSSGDASVGDLTNVDLIDGANNENEFVGKGNIEMVGFKGGRSKPVATNIVKKRRTKGENLVNTSFETDKFSVSEKEMKIEKERFNNEKLEEEIQFFKGKLRLSRRQLGILGAVINGAWGGNSMIPLHYASRQGFHGAGYLISFSCGAMLVTILMWICRYIYNLYCWDFDRIQAYNALPSLHLREMWLSGLVAGSLYSVGNFCSIITVTSLGQGVGYSFVQTSMLVSGLWGIFFFGEVQGFDRVWKWILSSMVTIGGILWLSYEHEGAAAH